MPFAITPPASWSRQISKSALQTLERRARRESPGARIERSADLRYRGQSYELNVPWTTTARAYAAFHRNTPGSTAIRFPSEKLKWSPFESAPVSHWRSHAPSVRRGEKEPRSSDGSGSRGRGDGFPSGIANRSPKLRSAGLLSC